MSVLVMTLLAGLAGTTRAGELDLALGLQATQTDWPDDAGGGPNLSAAWWFRPWIGASFIGKEHYAPVDDRLMSYYSVNAAVRRDLGTLRLGVTLGFVHQHEQTRAAIEAQPLASLFGVADGMRHRMATRSGIQLALPIRDRAKGEWYVALDLDGTVFAEADRGPRWMSSAGLSIGFTHDFSRKAPASGQLAAR
ncbi:MAG: hypothetical protein M3619_01860 [Myxococcota bacterium]|nr:hypothetical protein [Myxococcota bacterium]